MEHYSDAMKYAEAAGNSAGSGMEKFNAYTESLEARITRLTNAFQSLSTTVTNSDFLSGIVDLGTSVVNILDDIISSVGILNTAILGFSLYQGAKGSGETI